MRVIRRHRIFGERYAQRTYLAMPHSGAGLVQQSVQIAESSAALRSHDLTLFVRHVLQQIRCMNVAEAPAHPLP